MKNWRPILIFSDRFLDSVSWFMKVDGISLFPFIILRESYQTEPRASDLDITVRHENIHFQQALELFIIPFYVLYILEFLYKLPFYGKDAYYHISFEREAYRYQADEVYLTKRVRYNWIKLI